MDMITLALAKSYTDSQRLAYVEDQSLTFDGNISGKEMLEGYVRISEEPIDLNLVESITSSTVTPEGEQHQTFTKDTWSVLDEGPLQRMIDLGPANTPIMISVHQSISDDALGVVTRGVYVFYSEEDNHDGTKTIGYVSGIKMPETVHGIDPKFLPEGGFGYTEETVYTFDYHGDTKDPRLIYIEGDVAVKLSDSVVDLNNVSNISLTFDGHTLVVTDELIVRQPTDTAQILETNISDVLVTLISDQGNDVGLGSIGGPGLYAGVPLDAVTEGVEWTFSVEFKDTVHRIYPKYLPEGGFGYVGGGEVLWSGTIYTSFNGNEAAVAEAEPAPLLLEPGKEYEIKINSDTYNCMCRTVSDDIGITGAAYVGNLSLAGTGDDTGEPFLYMFGFIDGVSMAALFTVNEGVYEITVSSKEEIHGIDPKFLPDGGFGYTTSEPNAITFDGNSNGKTAFSYGNYSYMVKVADSISSLEDIVEVVVTSLSGEEIRIPVTPSDIESIPPGGQIQTYWENIGRKVPLVMHLNDYNNYEAGFYVWTAGDSFPEDYYVSKVIFKEEVEIHHKISPKYLPEGLGYISEEPESVPVYDIIWNDPDRSGYDIPVVDPYGLALRRLFDYTIDLNNVVSVSCFSTGNIEIYEKDGADRYYFVTDEHSISIPWNDGMRQIVVAHPESFEQDGEQWPAGTYVYADSTRYSLYEIVMYQIHKIDPKFLPSDIPTKSYVEELILGAIGGSY